MGRRRRRERREAKVLASYGLKKGQPRRIPSEPRMRGSEAFEASEELADMVRIPPVQTATIPEPVQDD